jgi:hypothetical protein
VKEILPSSVQWWQPPAGSLADAECLDAVCSAWIAGWETEGVIEVRATLCGHEYVERVEVPMDELGCHVETQEVDIGVDPRDCPATQPPATSPPPTTCSLEARPSVLVSVARRVPGGLIPFAPTAVHAQWRAVDATAPQTVSGRCLDEGCTRWALGHEQAGTFDVRVEACGETFGQEVEVGKTADGCHVETQQITVLVENAACAEAPVTVAAAPVATPCDLVAAPSAIVTVAQDGGDVLIPVPAAEVWFSTDRRRQPAYCIDPTADGGGCSTWVAGWELDGPMTVGTEWCEREVEKSFRVEKTEDGCHVQTRFVSLLVDGTGCLQAKPQPPVPPPPGGSDH